VQGTGKTTLAKLLCHQLNVDYADFLEINASQENNVETVREKIVNFCSTWSFGGFKVVLLDEADHMSPPAQAILRGVMEKYADMCRFILTCNYPNKIIPAIHSRCQGFHFDALNKDEFTVRVAEILAEEGIDFDVDTLDNFVRISHPDLRKCINLVQQHSSGGKLRPAQEEGQGTADYMLQMVELCRANKILEARKLVTGQARPEEYPEIYRFFYNNLDLWGEDESVQNQAILVIAKRLKDHALVADPEINLAACLIELEEVRNG
jgi:DNA polymerase III delta prime subunit